MREQRWLLAGVLSVAFAGVLAAQNPLRHFTETVDQRYALAQPVVHYRLSIRPADTTGWDVEISIRNARDTFRLAMAKHPEYDDRFFRFIQNMRPAEPGVAIVREDSVLWRVVAPGGAATISYRVQLPPTPSPRAAWRPFVSPTGTLTGGPHAFMYVVGAELAPVHVSLDLPREWDVVTALGKTQQPRTYFAPNVYTLLESPILAGTVSTWGFAVDGVPHTVAYWKLPGGAAFDTTTFVGNFERYAKEVVRLFGRPTYSEYVFQLQDGAYGALEHPASVTLGIPSSELARNASYDFEEVAHEFFHTWNLMRIRPAEYAAYGGGAGIDYRRIAPVPTLWFSEGLTMMYADLLQRRAQLPVRDSTRIAHLEYLLRRYYGQAGNSRFSAEHVSRVAYGTRPDELGDYDASTHLQGELLGTMLDLIIRDATAGRRSMDDVMRAMLARFSGERGFTSADVERVVADVCACDVHAFFAAHVRGAQPIAFDRYLALAGLRAVVTRAPVVRNGQVMPDSRIRAWNAPGDSTLSLILSDPASVWGRAGLHSRDRIVSVNGASPRTWPEFRQIIGRSQIGDTVRLVVRADASHTARSVSVVVTGYDEPVVHIERVSNPSARQAPLAGVLACRTAHRSEINNQHGCDTTGGCESTRPCNRVVSVLAANGA